MDYKNKTALVTGASSGIGRAFATTLASKGAHIILVALAGDALNAAAQDIQKQYGVKTLVVPADLSQEQAPATIYQTVKNAGWSVDVLVNAAGFGTRGRSHELAIATEHAQVMVNAVALSQLTYLFLPAMVAKNSGVIVNVGSSSASFWPGPYMAMYGASKAFVLSFTEALWGEYHTTGLRITTLCPAPTATGFHKGAGFTSQGTTSPAVNAKKRTPDQAVHAALRAIEANKPYVVDSFPAYLRAQLPRVLPAKVAIALAGNSLKQK